MLLVLVRLLERDNHVGISPLKDARCSGECDRAVPLQPNYTYTQVVITCFSCDADRLLALGYT